MGPADDPGWTRSCHKASAYALPALALLWAYVILSEDLSALQWAGVALVFGGIGWLSLQGAAAVGVPDRPAPVLADPA